MVIAAVDVSEHVIPRVFLAIAAVIVVARVMGAVARRLRQPPVVGEIVGGLLLGPTLLGALPGNLDEHLFPIEIRSSLTMIANLGLVIFMFIVGLELDTTLIKGRERAAAVISLSSIALPMVLGILLATYLYDAHSVVAGRKIELAPFALFIGASMSITAFPVLARIMVDRGMYRTSIGALTLACAAVDDVLAWSLLAIVLAVIDTGTFFTWEFPQIVGLSIAFALVMALIVRPLLARLVPAYHRAGRLTPNLAAVVLVGFLVSAFVTAEIGVHHILGAFVFGAMMPRRDAHALNLEVMERLEQLTVLLLLPVFFVTTGLGVDIGALTASELATLGLVLLTACAGKFVGATVAARFQGIGRWRTAAAVGTLMNTRGLTELIILSVGRERGVLDDRLFTILVVMAVVTTVITEPALRLFYPDRLLARDVAEAQKRTLGVTDAYRVLVAADDPDQSEAAVTLACDLVGDERPSEIVLSRLVHLGQTPELGRGAAARLADMTASIDAMAELERQVAASGIGARVLTRFSNEPVGDLTGQASAAEADIVLLIGGDEPATAARAKAMADELDRPVAVLIAGSQDVEWSHHTGVALAADDSDAGLSALELAARASRSRGCVLEIIVEGRRARRWQSVAEQLSGAGIEARVVGASQSAGVVVVAGGTSTGLAGPAVLHVFTPPAMGRTARDVVRTLSEPAVGPGA